MSTESKPSARAEDIDSPLIPLDQPDVISVDSIATTNSPDKSPNTTPVVKALGIVAAVAMPLIALPDAEAQTSLDCDPGGPGCYGGGDSVGDPGPGDPGEQFDNYDALVDSNDCPAQSV